MDCTGCVYCYCVPLGGVILPCVCGGESFLFCFIDFSGFCFCTGLLFFDKEKVAWLGMGRRSAMTHSQKKYFFLKKRNRLDLWFVS